MQENVSNLDEIIIRQATLADAQAIAKVKQAVWPDEAAPQESLIVAALQTATHQTFLAFVQEALAGFVSCFATVSVAGVVRWEIDLLAVHPDFRRRGIAGRLMKTAVSTPPSDATLTRGLIEVSNIGSQRSFARHGFQTDGTVHTLCISTNVPATLTPLPAEAHLVPVNTFNYSGLWIEGALSPAVLAAGESERVAQQRELVGVLIPESNPATHDYAVQNQFIVVGRYQWWERLL
ncbi:MAG: GNAT family N-acetyltransferase [Chloroflexota bacterium]